MFFLIFGVLLIVATFHLCVVFDRRVEHKMPYEFTENEWFAIYALMIAMGGGALLVILSIVGLLVGHPTP